MKQNDLRLAGQEQVLRFFDRLTDDSKQRLLKQIESIDLDHISRLVRETGFEKDVKELLSRAEPAPYIPLPKTDADYAERAEASRTGQSALRAGKVAALVVAGGLGTRLGLTGPKGAYPIGPVSGHSLFQIFTEHILAGRRRYGVEIPWYIMTSEGTDAETREFFAENDFFDLSKKDVRFFKQGLMPAVDFDGKLLLDAPDHIAESPDGHGGTLKALEKSGALEEMKNRGIEFISYFQVDNPIVTPLDAVFIGYHIARGSEMSCKMVAKAYPEEKLGVFGNLDDKLHVIEYSDLPKELAEARTSDGSLRFAAGSIAIHILGVGFAHRIAADEKFALPFHKARKKIPYVDEKGNPVEPTEPNGIKFEQFIFDALPLARRTMVLEVDRSAQFSPVKNNAGADSPEIARRDMVRLHARWLEEAGVEVPRDEEGQPTYKVEISPLAAEGPKETRALVRRLGLKKVSGDLFLAPPHP